MSEDKRKQAFLLEVQRLSIELEALMDIYGLRDKATYILLAGLIEPHDNKSFPNDEFNKFIMSYSYLIDNYYILEELIDFIVSTYVEPEKEELDDSDIDDLLDGLGVERE